MEGARTRGHDPALAAVQVMITGRAPHALLLVGPDGVGKTTLAEDLATGLLCLAEDPGARPCGACRACRLSARGSHPDLHRLVPDGPGGQIVIGGGDARYRGVRDLIAELALLPLMGPTRVAIVESAERMNEDAQAALLKTLEEPPAGLTIVLCADDEARLLPTIRSRCARLRLGPVGARDIERILIDRGVADAPTGARLARLAGGRPGVALAYAAAPEALHIRTELTRVLIDLLEARPAERLAAMRLAIPRALLLDAGLEAGAASSRTTAVAATEAGTQTDPRRRTRGTKAAAAVASGATANGPDLPETDDVGVDAPVASVVPARRRRAAERVVGIAIDVARDLALVIAGGARSVRDPDLLEEFRAAAAELSAEAVVAALRQAERAAMLIDANVNPELVLDDLALGWPRRRRVA